MATLFIGNRRLARAQAAFVALLYVFLCTFGTLTHTHAWIAGDVDSVEVATPAASTRSDNGGSSCIVTDRQQAGVPTHCAFCDWQANSVSVALPIQHCVLPHLIELAAPRQILFPITARNVQSSSRAPPIA